MSDADFRPLSLGDTSDDDPEVLDSLVQQEANPPTPPIDHVEIPSYPQPIPPTRLITVSQRCDSKWTSTQLLPADNRRVHLHIKVSKVVTLDTGPVGVVISDQPTTTTGRAVLYPNDGGYAEIDLHGHTGAIYATVDGDGSALVDVWSVTR